MITELLPTGMDCELIKYSQIDFRLVKKILDQISQGDYRQYMEGEFPELEADVAGLALIEQQCLHIAGTIRIIFAAKGVAGGLEEVIQTITEAYDELGLGCVHMLLPIFFAGDMQKENLEFIKGKQERDAALMVFMNLTTKDGLILDDLKGDFINKYPLSYLMPLHPHLKDFDK